MKRLVLLRCLLPALTVVSSAEASRSASTRAPAPVLKNRYKRPPVTSSRLNNKTRRIQDAARRGRLKALARKWARASDHRLIGTKSEVHPATAKEEGKRLKVEPTHEATIAHPKRVPALKRAMTAIRKAHRKVRNAEDKINGGPTMHLDGNYLGFEDVKALFRDGKLIGYRVGVVHANKGYAVQDSAVVDTRGNVLKKLIGTRGLFSSEGSYSNFDERAIEIAAPGSQAK